MTPREPLLAAKALIDTPQKWTKGALARDQHGRETLYDFSKAVCFCSLGAILKSATEGVDMCHAETLLDEAIPFAVSDDENRPYVAFQDLPETTHADVMALFDRAIAAAGDAP